MRHDRLVVVYNTHSTRASAVEEGVFAPLRDASVKFEPFPTCYSGFEDTVKSMADELPDGATILSAAGDGTAEQLANAALRRGKRGIDLWTLGFLPYGNFNDMSRAHVNPEQSVWNVLDAPVIDVHPMTVQVNGEYLQHASTYVSLGMTARIAAGFADPASRERMKRAGHRQRVARRLGQAARDYFRYKGEPLPAFRANNGPVMRDSTDVAIANNPIVAGMIRPPEPYYDQPYFGARADLNMGSWRDLGLFGIPSLVARSPLQRMNDLRLAFEQTASVPLQAGGAYKRLEGVDEIYIYKNPRDVLKVLHSKA